MTDGAGAGFFPLIRRWWWVILVTTLVTTAVGYFATSHSKTSYQTTTDLLVGPLNGQIDTIRAAGFMAQTYAQLATTRPLRSAVAKRLGVVDFPETVSASADDVTRLLSIRVRANNPARGEQIATALAAELIKLAESQPDLGTGIATPAQPRARGKTQTAPSAAVVPEGELRLVDPPQSATISSNKIILIFAAALVGLLGGFGLAVLLDRRGRPVGSPEDVERLVKRPFLGSVTLTSSRSTDSRLVVESSPASQAAKDHRLLAAKLTHSLGVSNGGDGSSLLVVGADNGTGSIDVAVNLAATIARSGAKVVVVDVERGNQLGDVLSLEKVTGVGELIDIHKNGGPQTAKDWLVPQLDGLQALPRGELDESLINIETAQWMLSVLGRDADLVIINSPPINQSSTTLTWAQAVTGSVLVSRRNNTRPSSLSNTAESFKLVDANVVGTVLTEKPGLTGRARPAR